VKLLTKLRNRLRIRHRIERIWPRFVRLDGGTGIYADRGTRLWVAAHPDVYERLARFVAKILGEEESFIDCGANFGWISVSVARQLKRTGSSGRVLAIEANGVTSALLSKTIRRNRLEEQISVAKTFVGEAQGEIEFYECGGMSSAFFTDHIKDAMHKYGEQVRTKRVSCSSIDSLVEVYRMRNVGVVKIDVEGAELSVLQGCQKLIKERPTAVFIVETNPVTSRAAGYAIREIWNFFASRGFHVFVFAKGPRRCLVRVEHFDEAQLSEAGDIIAVQDPALFYQRLGDSLSWD